MKLKSKRGQSTLEYIILVTAVVAVLIVFLGPSGVLRPALDRTLGTTVNGMETMADKLSNSHTSGGGGGGGNEDVVIP
ncbi:MAG: class III signal peptide-containing protein [Candidatus Omnitrophota bacterium]